MPNFTPSVQRQGCRTPKLKFLLRFDQNVEYKRPAGEYPFGIFTKFAEFVPHFRSCQLLKFGWTCSRGYGVMGVLSWGVWFPQIFSAPTRETASDPQKVLEVQKHARRPLSLCQVWWASDITRRRGSQKCWVFCLSVCLFVTLWNVRVCAPDFAMKALENRNDFDAGEGSYSTFWDWWQLATSLNAEVQKKRQNLGFFAATGQQNKPIERKFRR